MDAEKRSAKPTDSLLNICRRGDVELLSRFLAAEGNLEIVNDDFGRTPLHYCVEVDLKPNDSKENIELSNDHTEETTDDGRLKCAEMILQAFPRLSDRVDFDGMAVIHHAVIHNNLKLMKILLEHGADINIPLQAQRPVTPSPIIVLGRTVCHLAVMYGKMDILKALLDGTLPKISNPNLSDSQHAYPIHYAVQLPGKKAIEAVQILFKIGRVDLDSFDLHKRTPLIWAATIGQAESFNELLNLGADPTKKDESGLTALHCAASKGYLRIVQDLLSYEKVKGKELIELEDTDGCTPLFYCVTMGHKRVTNFLLESGGDATKRENKNRSLCHCATRPADGETSAEILRKLVVHGANPWLPNDHGDTPLHEACQVGNFEYVQELALSADFKEQVNITNAAGLTALHLAVMNILAQGQTELQVPLQKLCNILIHNQANLNILFSKPNDSKKLTILDALQNHCHVKERSLLIKEFEISIKSKGAKTLFEIEHQQSLNVNNSPDSGQGDTLKAEYDPLDTTSNSELNLKTLDSDSNSIEPCQFTSPQMHKTEKNLEEASIVSASGSKNQDPSKVSITSSSVCNSSSGSESFKSMKNGFVSDISSKEPESSLRVKKKIKKNSRELLNDKELQNKITALINETRSSELPVIIPCVKATQDDIFASDSSETPKNTSRIQPIVTTEVKEEVIDTISLKRSSSFTSSSKSEKKISNQDPDLKITNQLSLSATNAIDTSSNASSLSIPSFSSRSSSMKQAQISSKSSNSSIKSSKTKEPILIPSENTTSGPSTNRSISTSRTKNQSSNASLKSIMSHRDKMPCPSISPYIKPLVPEDVRSKVYMRGPSKPPTVIQMIAGPSSPKKWMFAKKPPISSRSPKRNQNSKEKPLRNMKPLTGRDKERDGLMALHQAVVSRDIVKKVQLSVSDFDFIRIAANIADRYGYVLTTSRSLSPRRKKIQSKMPSDLRGFNEILDANDTLIRSLKKPTKSRSIRSTPRKSDDSDSGENIICENCKYCRRRKQKSKSRENLISSIEKENVKLLEKRRPKSSIPHRRKVD